MLALLDMHSCLSCSSYGSFEAATRQLAAQPLWTIAFPMVTKMLSFSTVLCSRHSRAQSCKVALMHKVDGV